MFLLFLALLVNTLNIFYFFFKVSDTCSKGEATDTSGVNLVELINKQE
jgi:hypothetical protein